MPTEAEIEAAMTAYKSMSDGLYEGPHQEAIVAALEAAERARGWTVVENKETGERINGVKETQLPCGHTIPGWFEPPVDLYCPECSKHYARR